MHTNLDAADDGVGETLAKKLGLTDIREIEGTGENGNCGRIGFLEEPVEPEWLALKVKETLGCDAVRYVAGNKKVTAVAVIGGSGGDFAELVMNSGADAFVTADVKHHQFIYAKDSGFTLIDVMCSSPAVLVPKRLMAMSPIRAAVIRAVDAGLIP